MAIRDLLWACPLCGAEESIRPVGRGEACAGCGARFRRGRGAEIEATPLSGASVARHATEWAERLPPVRLTDEGQGETGEQGVIHRRAPVTARFSAGYAPVRSAGRFMGRIERLGPPVPGTLILSSRALAFAPRRGPAQQWPLQSISAVQASSGVLQVRPRGQHVAAFRFREGSVRLWEESVQEALRRFYMETGRGEILEFQPRIAVR